MENVQETGLAVAEKETALNLMGEQKASFTSLKNETNEEKQILEVKSQINKIPNKVSIVSVLFIVPLILLMILGPFIINLL